MRDEIAPGAGLLLAALPLLAGAGEWRLLEESRLAFAGEVESAPFTGVFETFSARVDFDPATPAAGHISAVVEVGSVDSGNRERDQYMRAREFFYVRRYPEAVFESTAIRADGDGGFLAEAQLTLRGETRPVRMRFTFETGRPARLRGTVALKRLDFGVGQGEWRDTRQIANEVTVNVDLELGPGS